MAGFNPVATLSTMLILGIIGWLFGTNAFGIRDWLKTLLRVPAPPGQARPLLARSYDVVEKEVEFRNGERKTIGLIVFSIKNLGSELAVDHRPQLWIELDDDVVFDNREALEQPGHGGSVPPGKDVGFELLDLLSEGSHRIRTELGAFGMEQALLNKQFVLHSLSTYGAPDRKRRFETGIYTLRFAWTAQGMFPKEVAAVIKGAYELDTDATRYSGS